MYSGTVTLEHDPVGQQLASSSDTHGNYTHRPQRGDATRHRHPVHRRRQRLGQRRDVDRARPRRRRRTTAPRRRSTTTRTSSAATASSTTARVLAAACTTATRYNNAFWDGTQMTYGDGAGNTKPADRDRRRRPRDVPRRHREHRRPRLHRRRGRPQRGDLRHLRHRRRVLRQQRRPTPATTSSARRSTSTATARRCATWTSRARTARPRTAGPRPSATSTRTTPRAR